MKRLLGSAVRAPEPPSSRDSGARPAPAAAYERHSHGLEEFLSRLQEQESLYVLDLGGVSQANVSFITGLGHKLYSEDFLSALDSVFGRALSQSTEELRPDQIGNFLRHNLDFHGGRFDGVLLWDALEFLPPPLLKAAVDRLFEITKPGSCMLAFFHADEKAVSVPLYSYRISDARTLLLSGREPRRPSQLFNNRGVEKLFHRFQSVKFFLTRDHLREVIVRR